jgi:hypothetical protein
MLSVAISAFQILSISTFFREFTVFEPVSHLI